MAADELHALGRAGVRLRACMRRHASLSGAEQEQLEIASTLLLRPRAALIDAPSIDLSLMWQFGLDHGLK
ncbi:hypothetical protein [Verminephrobacter aporrectodeae]|uniref:hypothetical protein n=1 Tax=Verminephrobacter aporrectodeae TaxID=1110389 RepID=UPI002ADE0A10|nr:hypothetical protein [Verminephrobacter aporrectodeae]